MLADTLPDMAVIDLAMPGVDGLELLDMCRQQWPSLPLIAVLSGFNRTIMGPVAMEHGAIAYIEKGLTMGTVVLDQLWAHWTRHQASNAPLVDQETRLA